MNNKYDLTDYAFAKDILKDFPLITSELDKVRNLLYKYEGYTAVAHVLYAIDDAREMMERQHRDAELTFKTKGNTK